MNQFVKSVRYYLNKIALGLGYLILTSAVVVASFIGYHEYSEIVRKEKFQAKYNPCGEGWPFEGFENITLDELKECMPMQNGYTRLTDAIASDRFDLVQFLIKNGFDVNEEAEYLQTPLIQAVQLQNSKEDYEAFIRSLIEAGAQINLASSFGETPLMRVARMRGDHTTIELLQSYGADPSLMDENGDTALHHAASTSWHGSVRVFQFLVEMGSDIRAKNLKGKTPYDLLWEHKDEWRYGNQSFEDIEKILDTSVSAIVEDTRMSSNAPGIESQLAYIHPQCLDFLGPWSKQDKQFIDCSGLDFSKVQGLGNEFGVRYGEGQAVAYKYADVDLEFPTGMRLLEVGVDGGGSGLFSSIVLLDRDQQDKTKYEILVRTPSGDRCNDGNKWVSEASFDGFIFKSAATPFRLLNPDDTTDWRNWYLAKALMDEAGEELDRPALFNGWEPYEDVTNSANACFGWIVRKFDYETGFEIIGVELNAGLVANPEDATLEGCINNWLAIEAEGLLIRKDEWLSRLKKVKSSCL
ncbi:ankyrin repeat domain-containing protein [Oceanospirillaceae bacterium]|nr:ankyrin repeat domain-containing protein [Oceanospirillaceae bacterium]